MLKRFLPILHGGVVGLVEMLLTLRILLKLLGASTKAPFVTWVYETTKPLLAPFENMFPTSSLGGGLVLEASSLFALVIYAFLGFFTRISIRENHLRQTQIITFLFS